MHEMNKLRWRCRRGTQELDLMLIRYLENYYSVAESHEQLVFLQLLELEDSELIRYLLGKQTPDNAEISSMVFKIRELPSECN